MPKAPAPPVTDQQPAAPVARVAVEADVRLSYASAVRERYDRIADKWDVRKHGTGPLFADYES